MTAERARFSIFELEEQLRQERARHLRMINSTLVGALVAVSWSYIVEQLADPYAQCPTDGCWMMIALLALSLVGGVFAIPQAQLCLQRTLGDFLSQLEALDSRRENLSHSAEGLLVGAAAVLAVERHSVFAPKSASRYGFRKAVVGKLLLLLTNAGDSAFVVTCANLLYYVTKQLEFEGSGESRFVRDELRGRYSGSMRGGRNFASVAGICASFCVVSAIAAGGVAIWSAKRLATESDPYRIRLWLLLSTHPHYPAAYAASIAVNIVFFAPLELNAGSPKLRAGLACLQLVLFSWGGRLLCRKIPPPPSDPETRLIKASASKLVCASFVAHDGCAVLAAIGVQNFLNFALRAFNLGSLLAVYCVYTPTLLINAHFRHRRRMQKMRAQAHHGHARDHEDKSSPIAVCCCSVQDAQFEDTAELWLITLGFWAPATIVLYVLWDHVILKTGDPVTTLLVRFLQQISIACLLTLIVAIIAGFLVVYREIYARCFLFTKAPPAPALHQDGYLQHQFLSTANLPHDSSASAKSVVPLSSRNSAMQGSLDALSGPPSSPRVPSASRSDLPASRRALV